MPSITGQLWEMWSVVHAVAMCSRAMGRSTKLWVVIHWFTVFAVCSNWGGVLVFGASEPAKTPRFFNFPPYVEATHFDLFAKASDVATTSRDGFYMPSGFDSAVKLSSLGFSGRVALETGAGNSLRVFQQRRDLYKRVLLDFVSELDRPSPKSHAYINPQSKWEEIDGIAQFNDFLFWSTETSIGAQSAVSGFEKALEGAVKNGGLVLQGVSVLLATRDVLDSYSKLNDYAKLAALTLAYRSDIVSHRLNYIRNQCRLYTDANIADDAFKDALDELISDFKPEVDQANWISILRTVSSEMDQLQHDRGRLALSTSELILSIKLASSKVTAVNPLVGAALLSVSFTYDNFVRRSEGLDAIREATLIASICMNLSDIDIDSYDYHYTFGRLSALFSLKHSKAASASIIIPGDTYWEREFYSEYLSKYIHIDAAPAKIAAYLGGYDLAIFPPSWITANEVKGGNGITVSWENRKPQAKNYRIYRGTSAERSAAVELLPAPVENYYFDDNVAFDVTYYYWVKVETADQKFSAFTQDFAKAMRSNPNPSTGPPFTLPKIIDAELNTAYTSAPLTISGLNGPTSVSVNRGSYSINGGPFGSGIGKVNNGDVVVVKHTSAANYFTTARATLAVGTRLVDFDISTAAFEALAVTVNLSSASALPRNRITVSGQVKNAGIAVKSGKVYVNSGPNTWEADIVNGSYSREVVTPNQSGNITVEAYVGGLTGRGSRTLTIATPTNSTAKITTAITRRSAITARPGSTTTGASIRWDYQRTSFSRADADVAFIVMVENGALDYEHVVEFRLIDQDGKEVDRWGGTQRSSPVDGFMYYYGWNLINGYYLGSRIGNYVIQYYLNGALVASKDFTIGLEIANFEVGVRLNTANTGTVESALAAVEPRTILFADEMPIFGYFVKFDRMSELLTYRIGVYKPGGSPWGYSDAYTGGGTDVSGDKVYWHYKAFVNSSVSGSLVQGWPFYLTVPPFTGDWLIGLEAKHPVTGQWNRLAEKHLTVVDRTPPDANISIRRNDVASEIFGENFVAKVTFSDAYRCSRVTLFWDGAFAGNKVLVPDVGQWWWESNLGPFFQPETINIWAEVIDTSGNVRVTPKQAVTVTQYGRISPANSQGIGFQVNALAFLRGHQNYYAAGGVVTATDTAPPSGYIQRFTHAPKLPGHSPQEVYRVTNTAGAPVPPISDVQISPDGLFLYAVADRYLIVFAVRPDGQLEAPSCFDSTAWRSDPRAPSLKSIAIHPSGQRILLADEGRNAVISVQRRFADNGHVFERWLALPESTNSRYAPPSQLLMNPSGREVALLSNLTGAVGWLGVEANSGQLPGTVAYTAFFTDASGNVPVGEWRHAEHTSDGQMLYIASYLGGTVNSYRRNDASGLWEKSQSLAASTGAPFSFPTTVTISPDSRNVYVLSSRLMGSSGVYDYARDLLSGQLKQLGSLTRGTSGAGYLAEQFILSAAPDGYKVYYVSRTTEAILQFQRAGSEFIPQIVAAGQARGSGAVEPATGWVTAGGANLTYQWYQGASGDRSAPVGGATAPAIVFPAVPDTRTYWVAVSNRAGSVASAAVTVSGITTVAPVFVANPASQTTMETGAVTFAASAQGVPAPALRWQVRTAASAAWSDLSDGVAATGGGYSGVSTPSLRVSGTTVAMSGYQYRCVASNTSLADVASNAAVLIVSPFQSAPSFAGGQPESQKASASGHASFMVTVGGTPAPALRWQVSTDGGTTWTDLQNGGNYSGVTSSTLVVDGATAAMNGYKYRAVASNAEQTGIASNAVTLSVGLFGVLADMVAIPGGTFTMGDSKGEGRADERPLHSVTVSSFYLWKTEVTYAQWSEVAAWNRAGSRGYDFRDGQRGLSSDYVALADTAANNLHPVVQIAWWDAVKWCNAKSRKDGFVPCYYSDASFATELKTGNGPIFVNWTANGYRLPTEAEWEYAARGGLAGNSYPWGDGVDSGKANYRFSDDPFDGTTPVAYYNGAQTPTGVDTKNGFGLYDMAGNVSEWCWDFYGAYFSSASIDPRGPASGSAQIHRGGSWLDDRSSLRVATRTSANLLVYGIAIGLRPAQLLPPAPAIGFIADQTIRVCQSTTELPFVVADAETPAANLILSVASSNVALVPISGVVFGGAGSNRTVRVTPLLNQVGESTITVTVSDGRWSSSTSFVVKVDVRRVFVRAGATGRADGSSWTDAYPRLDTALANSEPGDRIWVAEGTYFPTTTTDRAARFLLLENQQIIGGFGGTETTEAQADAVRHPTVLSGDIGVAQDPTDNSLVVLEVRNNARLANLTIRAATGTDHTHGGLLMPVGSNGLLIEDCIFADNVSGAGAGLTSYGADTRLVRCLFRDNKARRLSGNVSGNGGGALLLGVRSAVTGCTFLRNSAEGDGGGVRATAADLVVTNSLFEDNSGVWGGGVNGAGSLDHVVFRRNKAQNAAAAYVGAATLSSCVIVDNTAEGGIGFGAVKASGNLVLENCLFAGNNSTSAGTSAGRSLSTDSDLAVVNCTFWSAYSGTGQATEIIAVGNNNRFVNVIFWEPDSSSLPRYYRGRSASFLNSIVKGGLSGGKLDVFGTLSDLGGNLASNPQFSNPASFEGPDGIFFTSDDGFSLKSASPARDVGYDGGLSVDLAGVVRPVGNRHDIGAYEYPLGVPQVTLSSATAVKLAVASSAGAVVQFRWQVSSNQGAVWNDVSDQGAYAGASTSELTVAAGAQTFSGYQYRVVATVGSRSTTSTEITLLSPSVGSLPLTIDATAGTPVVISAAVTGVPTPAITWQVSSDGGTSWSEVNAGGAYAGVSTANLTIVTPITTMAGWRYRVRLVGSGGEVVTSTSTTLAVAPARTSVTGWGLNDYGQLTVPTSLGDAIGVAAGVVQVAGLSSGGQVIAWGDPKGSWRQIPAGLSNVVAIASGYAHVLALRLDGSVEAWGFGNNGQTTVPPGLTGVAAIAGGDSHSLALKSDGTVAAWGSNGYGQITIPSGLSEVIAIAAGGNHNLALRADGSVVAWGWNSDGQATVPTGLTGAVKIAAGYRHSLALKADGTIVAWGATDLGQAVLPVGLSSGKMVACGAFHSLLVPASGGVISWGDNRSGQSVAPVGLNNVLGVAGGGYFSVILQSAGSNTAPMILAAPVNQSVVVGEGVSFSATIAGSPTPLLQWQVSTDRGSTWTNVVNGIGYSGVNTGTLTIAGTALGLNDSRYRVVATNLVQANVASTGATLTVNSAPVFVVQPQSQAVAPSAAVSFTTSAVGPPNPTYRWQVSENSGVTWNDLTDDTVYFGAATSALSIYNATVGLAGNHYRAVATNLAGSVASASAMLSLNFAPAFVQSPAAQTVRDGSSASFSVTAVGPPTPTYRWQVSSNAGATWTNLVDGGIYDGATTSTLTITPVGSTANGSYYRALASNPYGSNVPSASAALSVDSPPSFTVQPQAQTAAAGASVTFSTAVVGLPVPALQWQFSVNNGGSWTNLSEGSTYAGTKSATLSVNGLTSAMSGIFYRALASNSVQADVASSTAGLTVLRPTYADWQAANFTAGELANPAISGLVADADSDGLNNLLEYAFGLTAKVPDTANWPVLGTSAGGALTLTYTRRNDTGDLTYTVEASNDLVTWVSGAGTTQETSLTALDATRDRVLATDLTALSGTTRRFLRLRVNHTSGAVAKTVPLGGVRPTFAPGPRYAGMTMVNPAVARDLIASHSGNVLTLGYGSANYGAMLTTGTAYYVELSSGPASTYVGERLEVDVTATKTAANNTLTVLPSAPRSTLTALPSASGLAGYHVTLRPHVTLGQIFGTKDNPLMQGSTVVSTADQVQVFNLQTQAFDTYYFLRNASGSVAQWTKVGGGSTVQDTLPIPPGVGVAVVRNAAAATTLTWLGEVRLHGFAQPLVKGNNLVCQPLPVDATPLQRVLTFANGVTGSTVTTSADRIQLLAGGATQTYYLLRNASGSVEQWTRVGGGSTNHNNTALFTADGAAVLTKINADPHYFVPLLFTP